MAQTGLTTRCEVFPPNLPNEYRQDPSRRAELLVYDALSEQLPAGWKVFYDVAWLAPVRGPRPQDGQTDFIVAHRDIGALLIEVKGGAIAYDGADRRWTSTTRAGNIHEIKDPFRQVETNRYALLEKLKGIPALSGCFIRLNDAVAFPDVMNVSRAIAPDAPSEVIITAEHLERLPERIMEIFQFYGGGRAPTFEHGDKILAALMQTLAASTQFPHPLKVSTSRDEQEIVKLTKDQFKLLDQLNRRRRVAVAGCAGSGKTFLAVEKAKRLANEGFRTLLTCFNSALATELKRCTQGIEGLEVSTFHSLCWKHVRQANITVNSSSDNDEQSTLLAGALSDAMAIMPEARYDAILVDEAQDFHPDWWIALEDSLQDGKTGVLYVFFDDNQTLYRGRGSLPNDMYEFELVENIRNSRPICAEVTRLYSAENTRPIYPRGPTGRPIEKYTYDSQPDFQRQAGRVLERLVLNEQIPSSELVVLTPKSLEYRSKLLELKLPAQLTLTREAPQNTREILCSTIHGFKGLERRIVIVAELDNEFLELPEQQRLSQCYVAFSRARTHLIVFAYSKIMNNLFPQ